MPPQKFLLALRDRLALRPRMRSGDRRELERAVEQMRERLAQTTVSRDYLHRVLNSMTDAVFVTDAGGNVRIANDAACRLTGLDLAILQGRAVASLLDNPTRLPPVELLQRAHASGEAVLRTQAGQTIPVSFTGSDIAGSDPQFAGCIFVARDITERKRAERRIRYLARYDSLTKIPNRMQFQHLLQQASARSLRQGTGIALLYLDMDRFKEVNDTFGHAAGDRVLESLTERLTRLMPPESVLGRLAGDEFAVFLDNLPLVDAEDAAHRLADSILQAASMVFEIHG